MKRWFLLAVLFFPLLAWSQNYLRFDPSPVETVVSLGGQTNIGQFLSYVTITLCGYPRSPSGNTLCTNLATSYTGPSGSACPSGSPVVLQNTSVCTTASDVYGNFGFWVASGSYGYCISGAGVTTQCYDFTAGIPLNLSTNNLSDWTNAGVAANYAPLWNTGTLKWTPGAVLTSAAMSVPAALLSVSGSPITQTGTFAVSLVTQSANCVFAGPTSGGAATPTCRPLVSADLPSSSMVRTCMIVIGADNGAALVTADIQPQKSQCYVDQGSTVTQVVAMENAGASTVGVGYRHNGSVTAISPTLTPATVSGITDTVACANTGGTAITIEGNSVTCTTLSNTALTKGDFVETNAGSADATTKRVSLAITFTVP